VTEPRPQIPSLSALNAVIQTGRFRLRPFRISDVDDIWPIVSDPEFPKMMSWHAHKQRAETVGFIERVNRGIEENTNMVWAIEHQGRASGSIGLHDIQWESRAWRLDRGELGFWLAPALWGKQIMSEAAREVVHWGFKTLGLHKITVGCFEENAASRRVIDKLGFRYVGKFEDDVWRDGRWWNHLRFELTSGEWFDIDTTMPITISRPPART
jgi:[ribosomal protein S5]-alanine N-acetyltransferase